MITMVWYCQIEGFGYRAYASQCVGDEAEHGASAFEFEDSDSYALFGLEYDDFKPAASL